MLLPNFFLFAGKETSLLVDAMRHGEGRLFVYTRFIAAKLSVFMMPWNLSWACSHLVEVIDGFCRVVVSSCDSILIRSVCMFSWGNGYVIFGW
jgi:hypothetical protein